MVCVILKLNLQIDFAQFTTLLRFLWLELICRRAVRAIIPSNIYLFVRIITVNGCVYAASINSQFRRFFYDKMNSEY